MLHFEKFGYMCTRAMNAVQWNVNVFLRSKKVVRTRAFTFACACVLRNITAP